MPNLFDIGVSALSANQRAMVTTGHNITNVNTEGYSRQRAELVSRPGQMAGNGFIGKGVEVATVSRAVDQFLVNQVRTSTTNQSQAGALHSFASQLNNLLANANTGLAPALQGFFDGVQDAADDPASIPARQSMLSGADTLMARFHDVAGRIDDINEGVNDKLVADVQDINNLTKSIAGLNERIVLEMGKASGQIPNDLLDQRDQNLVQLARLVGINTVTQDDGAVNVLVGNGQVLVAGSRAQTLDVTVDPLDASRKEVSYTVGVTRTVISDQLNSGEIGAALEFRQTMLDPARNSLGRIAAGFVQSFNAQHREGMDLNGALGGDFFALGAPGVSAASANTGTVSVAFDPDAIGGLQAADYSLRHDGASFTLTNLTDGSAQTLTGAGPFSVDGLVFTVGTAPAAGDTYLIQPTRNLARDVTAKVTDARDIALAAPIRAHVAPANISDAQISAGEVLDGSDPSLLAATSIVFNDPPNTYQINGAGPSLPYTTGANIDVNGWRVQISGAPEPGDQFIVQSNSGGVSDNRNALGLGRLQDADILVGGSATYFDAYAQIIGEVGSRTRQAGISETALTTLLDSATQAQQQVSGVNLDEEAANLLRFQQAYEAAARIIATADAVFQSLLNAVSH